MDVYLRDYHVNPGLMPEFFEGWWTRVLRLRERCGFTLLGAWADEADDRFVCVLGLSDPATSTRPSRTTRRCPSTSRSPTSPTGS